MIEMVKIERLVIFMCGRIRNQPIVIRQLNETLVQPDPTRLSCRNIIRSIVKEVVLHPEMNAVILISQQINERVSEEKAQIVKDLVNEELRVLHEGTLIRYGIEPEEFECWRNSL